MGTDLTDGARCIFNLAILLGRHRTRAVSEDLVGQHHVLDWQDSSAFDRRALAGKGTSSED